MSEANCSPRSPGFTRRTRTANSTADETSASVSSSICTERTMPSVGCGGGRRASRPSTLLISLFSHSAQVYGRNTEDRGAPPLLPSRRTAPDARGQLGNIGPAYDRRRTVVDDVPAPTDQMLPEAKHVPIPCPIGRSTGELTGTPGQPDTPACLQTGRLTRCATRLLSSRSLTQPSEPHGMRIVGVSRLAEWTIDRAATRRAGDIPPLAPCAWHRLLLPRSAAGWS